MVGTSTSQGVVAHFITDLESECRGATNGNTRPQAFWLFSVNACGAYGFDGAKVSHAGRGDPVGQATVTSNRTLEISSGSGMLLRVDRSAVSYTHLDVYKRQGHTERSVCEDQPPTQLKPGRTVKTDHATVKGSTAGPSELTLEEPRNSLVWEL